MTRPNPVTRPDPAYPDLDLAELARRERRYRELEDAAALKRAAKLRRQPMILIALVNTLCAAVALTAVADLRRLGTPAGTALAWTQAAVFGDCTDYLKLSVAGDQPDPRSRDQLCADLRSATAHARSEVQQTGLRLGAVTQSGATAQVALTISRKGSLAAVTVQLVRRDGQWRVLRDSRTCGSVGCG